MLVGEACNREVVFVAADAAIDEAARLIREYHVGDLVVVDERDGSRYPVGILTDRDLVVEVLAGGVAIGAVDVGDIMSRDLLAVHEDDELFDTIRRMREQGVRRVPVVDRDGMLQGILAVDDLIDLVAEQLNNLVALIGNELRHERERRSDPTSGKTGAP